MHLERTSSGNDDRRVWSEATDAALDVTEFFHPHIRSESTLRQDIANLVGGVTFLRTSELESYPVSKDRRVSMGDVRKGTSMDEYRGALNPF